MKILRPAKHTRQSFDDQQAVSLVSAWVAETKLAMPDLKSNDKWPNIDGYIALVDGLGFELGTVKVQVKKMSASDAKHPRYTFRDDKFLAYCREQQDFIPIIFVGVDLHAKIAYWAHIDRAAAAKMTGRRTLPLVKTQRIASGDHSFVGEWSKICGQYSSKLVEFEKYKKLYDMVSDVVSPALGRSDPSYVPVHAFLDGVNGLLDREFSVVKRTFYPGAWKLGFAYGKFDESSLSYFLYPINQSRNDVQIKELGDSLFDAAFKDGSLGYSLHSGNPVLSDPGGFARQVVAEKTKTIVEGRLLDHSGDEFLAREFVFAFVDKFHRQMGLIKKDSYSVAEIDGAFGEYLPGFLYVAHKIMLEKDRNGYRERVARGQIRYHDPDRMSWLDEGELAEVGRLVLEAVASKSPFPSMSMGNESMPFGLFAEFLSVLKAGGFITIDRPYPARDYTRLGAHGGRISDAHSDEAKQRMVAMLVEHLPRAYRTVVHNNFPLLERELSLLGDATTLAAIADLTERGSEKEPSYHLYLLEPVGGDAPETIILNRAEQADLERAFREHGTARVRGVEYRCRQVNHSVMRFLWEDTPLLFDVYRSLLDRLRKYFLANGRSMF